MEIPALIEAAYERVPDVFCMYTPGVVHDFRVLAPLSLGKHPAADRTMRADRHEVGGAI